MSGALRHVDHPLVDVLRGGLVAWIGLVAVVQNILSSLFNSHLSDFYQGWLYLLVVGIAASTIYGPADAREAPAGPNPDRR